MPRNSNGVMTIVNPDFVPATTIKSSETDANNDDIADEITNSLPRDGVAGMEAQLPLSDGTVGEPAIAFTLDTDTGVYRIGDDNLGIAAGGTKVLDIDGSGVGVSAGFAFTGDITPAQITADQNDYAPTGHGTAFVFRLASDASRNITGLDGGADGRVVRFRNVGTFNLVLKDEDANSTAANRFALSGDFTLLPDESADLQYDATLTRWTLAANSFNVGGIATETTVAANDELVIRDTSASGLRRMTFTNALKVVNLLTAEATPAADDKLILYDTSASAADSVTAGLMNPFGLQLFHVRDEKTQGTEGGTFLSGAWRTRTLNTSATNEITGASLGSNQITLPAGTYFIDAHAPAFGIGRNKARLFNTTDTATTLIGTSEDAEQSDGATTDSAIRGRFTIAAQKVFELQHQCETSLATRGFGVETNLDVEVYAEVLIWKIR